MAKANWFIGGAMAGIIGLGATIVYREYLKERDLRELNAAWSCLTKMTKETNLKEDKQKETEILETDEKKNEEKNDILV